MKLSEHALHTLSVIETMAPEWLEGKQGVFTVVSFFSRNPMLDLVLNPRENRIVRVPSGSSRWSLVDTGPLVVCKGRLGA